MRKVPIVSHYRHLGGQLVRTGTIFQEVRTRAATAASKAVPLKKLLQNPQIDHKQRRQLFRSMVWSVFTVHVGSWFNLNEGEFKTWQGAWFRLTGAVFPRNAEGNVPHTDYYQRADQIRLPMPMEVLYLQRLRLLVCLLQENDHFMIGAILANFKHAGRESWPVAVQAAILWMRQQVSDDEIPRQLGNLQDWTAWNDLQPFHKKLKRLIKKAEKSHLLRVRAFCELKQTDIDQQAILSQAGWTLPASPNNSDTSESFVQCSQCQQTFKTEAALATHEQRKHGSRVALRRLVQDGCCRVCHKQFHTRYRLIQHLNHGQGSCWIRHFRCIIPMTVEETDALDEKDRSAGLAAHSRMFHGIEDDRACRKCTEDEWRDGPQLRQAWADADDTDPTADELLQWGTLGLLPPGRGGRACTKRSPKDLMIHNVLEDLQEYERNTHRQLCDWEAADSDVPRPLVQSQKYILLFFAGNRRDNDMGVWIARFGDAIPIHIDTAIHPERGNVFNDKLWLELISRRKVLGGHAGPPCESYSLARWLAVEGAEKPRPLRNKQYPWGLAFIQITS